MSKKQLIKDDAGLITEEMSRVIHDSIFALGAHRLLHKEYEDFLKQEPHCAQDVHSLINAYSKIIIHSSILPLIRNNTITAEAYQAIESQVKATLKFSFAIGYKYGRARMEPSFTDTIKDDIKNQFFDDVDEAMQDPEIDK